MKLTENCLVDKPTPHVSAEILYNNKKKLVITELSTACSADM